MLLITHDLGVVAETCDKVAVMYAGEIVEYGSLEDIFDETAHPYTEGLFSSLPSLDRKDTAAQAHRRPDARPRLGCRRGVSSIPAAPSRRSGAGPLTPRRRKSPRGTSSNACAVRGRA